MMRKWMRFSSVVAMSVVMMAAPLFAQAGICCLTQSTHQVHCDSQAMVPQPNMPCHQQAPQRSPESDCAGDCVLTPGAAAQPQFLQAMLVEKAQVALLDPSVWAVMQVMRPKTSNQSAFLLAKQAQAPPDPLFLKHHSLRL